MEEDLDIVKLNKLLIIPDTAITSNITKVIIRRDLKAVLNTPVQYELCYGNQFHVEPQGRNIKSTGFKIAGEIFYSISYGYTK